MLLHSIGSAEAGNFLADALGSVRLIVNEAGEVALVQNYQPYGSVLASAGDGLTSYGFTGEWTDSNTDLVYLRTRWYSPEKARFISGDSWDGDPFRPITYNGWQYSYGNPVNLTDPTGKDPITTCIGLLALAAAMDGPLPIGDAAGLIACGALFATAGVSISALVQHADELGGAVDTVVDRCEWTWEKWLQQPSTEPERVPIAPPAPQIPTDTPEPSSTIITYRELDGDLSSDKSYYKKPVTSPSQFREDADGVSTFEILDLPGIKPYALGFNVKVKPPVMPGTIGRIFDLPMCTATFTPEFGGGKKHWSVKCMGYPTNVTLSQYAKGVGKPNIILNPKWIKEPSERRLP